MPLENFRREYLTLLLFTSELGASVGSGMKPETIAKNITPAKN